MLRPEVAVNSGGFRYFKKGETDMAGKRAEAGEQLVYST